tara:strand:+ start:493 stop:702 length:210 start_codon:yes stop_codon:yes gene_type:complete
MKVSKCCGAVFSEPGYPDSDICSSCSEHADPIEEEKPSIEVIEMPYIVKQNKWKHTTEEDSKHFKGERR